MGTFAETALADYRFSFAGQDKQTSIFRSVCSKQMEDFHFCFPFASRRFLLFPFFVYSNKDYNFKVYA
jgi:hypothetical protein